MHQPPKDSRDDLNHGTGSPVKKRKPKKLTRKQRRKWLKHVANLRASLPLPYPARVRTMAMDGQGYCFHEYDRFGRVTGVEVQVANWLDYLARIDCLIHEWAHALECAAYGTTVVDHHSECWGVMLSKCYRATDNIGQWITDNGLEE